MSAPYNCPECDGELRHYGGPMSDWECTDCEAMVQESGGYLYTDPEPDTHGSRVHVYEMNDAERGMHHE